MKNLLFLAILSVSFILQANAQRPIEPDSEHVFVNIDQMPQFPGGEAAMQRFIQENLKIPTPKKHGTVSVQFVVRKDGTIKDIRIMKPLGLAQDSEVIKMISAMPNWIPGKHNGRTVNVRYLLPVEFK